MKFETVEQVWKAIDEGKTIYWGNTAYKVYVEENIGNEDQKNCAPRAFSRRIDSKGDNVLSVRCIENYFGSVISPNCLGSLFLKESK
jgi:hypothetical protein